jgi:hypothetical protein
MLDSDERARATAIAMKDTIQKTRFVDRVKQHCCWKTVQQLTYQKIVALNTTPAEEWCFTIADVAQRDSTTAVPIWKYYESEK